MNLDPVKNVVDMEVEVMVMMVEVMLVEVLVVAEVMLAEVEEVEEHDVKAANILLDEDFEAVVGDFGLAKPLDHNDSHITTAVRGTVGHIALEYLSTSQSSEKTNVFGFGILLLELITGQKALDFGRATNQMKVGVDVRRLALDHKAGLGTMEMVFQFQRKVLDYLHAHLYEQEIQQLQKQAKILKENSLNKLNALKTTIQHLSSSNSSMYYEFREAFHRLFNADVETFKDVLSRNMQNLEKQLNKETLHEKDSNSGLSMIKVQFDNFIHSRVLELSNSNSQALEITQDFKAYTNMEAQTFKETIIQNIDFIEQCIVERARHEQEIHNRLKRLNERKLQIQECMVQKVKASDASSGEKDCSRIVSDNGNDQGLENHSNTSGDTSNMSRNECNDKSTSGDDTDIRPSYDTGPMVEVPYTTEYNVFAVDTQHFEQSECTINTCVVERVDSNVIPDS
ncbi:hypothetical protein Tco_0424455 [Tanacetum coccineum]